MAALASNEGIFLPLFDIGSVWAQLWRGRIIVLGSVCAAVSLAVLYLAVATPTHTATASLLVDPRDARSTEFEAVLPGIGADSAAIASQVFVIESRNLLMTVFDAEGMARDPEFADAGFLSFLPGTGGTERDDVFRRFEKRISVERAGLTYVIKVTFKSRSAQKAARIANAIAARYTADLASERENATGDVNRRLSSRVAGLQKDVTDADRAVTDFKVRNDLLDPAAGGTPQSQIDQLTTRIIAARADMDQATARYDQAIAAGKLQSGAARLSEIVSSTALDGLRNDYNQRAAAIANAETIYQPHHPTVRRLRSELRRTETLIATEAGRIARELKAKRDLATEAVSVLEVKLAGLREKSRTADAARVQLRRLEAKAEVARNVLDDVLKRTEETAQMRGLQLSEARIIGLAAPPVQPSWPIPMLVLPVSAAIGLLAGCGLAVARTVSPQETESEAVVIPDMEAAVQTGAAPACLGHYTLPASRQTSTPARIRAMRRRFLQHDGATFSRSALQLVRHIIARLSDHPPPFLLLISSVGSPMEAKLASAMIGIGLQQAGQRVLVIEFTSEKRPGAIPADVYVNGASGLPTLLRPLAPTEDDSPFAIEEPELDRFDFVLLLGPSVTDENWNGAFFAQLDLMLFALSSTESVSHATEHLQKRLADDTIKRAVTFIVTSEDVMTTLPLALQGENR